MSQTFEELNQKAIELMEKGDLESAVKAAEEAVRAAQQTGDDSKKLLGLSNLSQVQQSAGDFEGAEETLTKAIELSRSISGDSNETADLIGNLAVMYSYCKEYENAEQVFREELEIRDKVGTDYQGVVQALQGLAECQMELQNPREAVDYLDQAVSVIENKEGKESTNIAPLLVNKAVVFTRSYEYEKAGEALREALRIYEKNPGPDHPVFADTLARLAETYEGRGAFGPAESLYTQAVGILSNVLDKNDPEIGRKIENLAQM